MTLIIRRNTSEQGLPDIVYVLGGRNWVMNTDDEFNSRFDAHSKRCPLSRVNAKNKITRSVSQRITSHKLYKATI